MKNANPCRFHTAESARSFIRAVADKFSDPESMLEFLTLLDIANATLVLWLIEENEAGNYSSLESGTSEEFRLAAEKLRKLLHELQQI